jgi:hypothetical protein
MGVPVIVLAHDPVHTLVIGLPAAFCQFGRDSFSRYGYTRSVFPSSRELGVNKKRGKHETFWFWRPLQGIQTASFNLITSFGACARSCFVPKYRSVV